MTTVLPRTDAHAFIKLNLKRMLQATRIDAHVLLFKYAFIIKMQLCSVRLIELCYYNNSATSSMMDHRLASSHATIATLLSSLKPCRTV